MCKKNFKHALIYSGSKYMFLKCNIRLCSKITLYLLDKKTKFLLFRSDSN